MVKVIIDPEWDLEAAIDAAFTGYIGSGKSSKGFRMSVLMTWANVVGRTRAVRDLEALYAAQGSRKASAAWLGVGRSTLAKVDQRFREVPDHSVLVEGAPTEALLDRLAYGERLGDGAVGEVWLATDALGRSVAVKFMHPEDQNDAAALDHARALGPVGEHPNVVNVYYCSYVTPPDGGKRRLGVVMAYVEGETLERRMRSSMGRGEARSIGTGLSSALVHIHEKGMIHGDLHAGNVLIRSDGSPVLIDLINKAALASYRKQLRDEDFAGDERELAELLRGLANRVQPGAGAAIGGRGSVAEIRHEFLEAVGVGGVDTRTTARWVGSEFMERWQEIERLIVGEGPLRGKRPMLAVQLQRLVSDGALSEEDATQILMLRDRRNRFVHFDPLVVSHQDVARADSVLVALRKAASTPSAAVDAE